MSAAVAVQALLSGLSAGAAYGLVALGFSLVRRLTGVYALAHGDIVVTSVFLAVLVVLGAVPVASPPGGLPSVVLVLLAPTAGAVLSVLVYLAAVRPFL